VTQEAWRGVRRVKGRVFVGMVCGFPNYEPLASSRSVGCDSGLNQFSDLLTPYKAEGRGEG
jgi:hypothetical protein